VSLTLRALREAERVLVLVSGADKVDAVRKAKAGAVPAGMIDHAEWLVARESAG
jgi:6-phosphogluconolactonase/glucosamine-6-phosphate isomerase/deaminase